MTRSEFCAIWRKWDDVMAAMPRHPNANYGKTSTDRMVAADLVVAETAGTAHQVIRRRLAEARREGMSHEDAFDAVVGS